MKPATKKQGVTTGPWVEIDLGALCANYAMIRDLAPGAETAAVVKCNGYGLGAAVISRALAERENCQTFFVAYPEEGAALRRELQDITPAPAIYVFNGPSFDNFALFESANLIPVLNSFEQAKIWANVKPDAPAALHIDTGMNRLGAPVCELDDIEALKSLRIDTIMSHLACASDPAHPKNMAQRKLFDELAIKFPDARRSVSASGGALMDSRYHYDLLRVGIALYGASPFDEDDERIKPVAALRAPVLQIRTAAAGETVGYGATHTIESPARLAAVALGYGDGLPRAAAERGYAVINGEPAPIAGRISMDLITLDVSGVKTPVKPGEIAEFFGPALPIHEAATNSNTIAYELLTGLGGRVDRRYL